MTDPIALFPIGSGENSAGSHPDLFRLVGGDRLPDRDGPFATVLHRGCLEAHALALAEQAPLVLVDVEFGGVPSLEVALGQTEAAQGGDVGGVGQPVQESRSREDEMAVRPLPAAGNPARHLSLPANKTTHR
jgi:hypothetical protein